MYRRVAVDSDEPVQYAAVHVLKWPACLGEPDTLFMEIDDSAVIQELKRRCESEKGAPLTLVPTGILELLLEERMLPPTRAHHRAQGAAGRPAGGV